MNLQKTCKKEYKNYKYLAVKYLSLIHNHEVESSSLSPATN